MFDDDPSLVRLKFVSEIRGRIGWQQLTRDEFTDKGPYLVTGTHFDDKGGVDWDRCYHVSEERWAMDEGIQLEQEDVLVTKDGTVGKLAYIDELPKKACLNSHILVLRPADGQYIGKYLFYILSSDLFRKYCSKKQQGTTFDAITQTNVENFQIPLYNVAKQKRIVDFLDKKTSEIDSLLIKKDNLLKKLQERRGAVLNEFLENSMPENYVCLKYLVDSLPGYAFSSDQFSNNKNDIRLLRGINVGVGEIRWDETEYWPAEQADDYEKYMLEPKDIVLGMDRPWISEGIRIAQISESDIPALLVQRVLRIRAKSGMNQGYVRMALESERFRQYFEPITTGVSVPHISQKQVGEFKIPVSSDREYSKISHKWEQAREKNELLEEKIKNSINLLEEKRQALITAAVTGQINLSNWDNQKDQELPA